MPKSSTILFLEMVNESCEGVKWLKKKTCFLNPYLNHKRCADEIFYRISFHLNTSWIEIDVTELINKYTYDVNMRNHCMKSFNFTCYPYILLCNYKGTNSCYIFLKKKIYFACLRYIDINKFTYLWKVPEGNFEDTACYVDYEVLSNASIFFRF